MDSAVAELYRVFQPYRLENDLVGCRDCVSPIDSQHLIKTPLSELGITHLNRYAFKAMTTWGDVRDFKHFLPRLLELSLDDFQSFDFPEVLFGKLTYALWKKWPSVEQEAINRFLMAFWVHQLEIPGDFPHDDRICVALGSLSQACETLCRFLEVWPTIRTESSALHLAQLINNTADEIMTTGIFQLWGKPNAQCNEVVKWMRSNATRTFLLSFEATVDAMFPFVLSQLDGIQASYQCD